MSLKNTNQTFIVIEKTGTIKEVTVKKITVDELYKKCGFRKAEGFEVRNTWDNVKVGNQLYNVQVWGKIDGKANTENKYDFPPPFDTQLLFGSCALVQVDKNEHFTSLTKEQWLKLYETLFGGFEDIDNEDEESEPDELESIKKDMKTKKGGYLKDGFVVDSSSEEEILVSEESDEDSDVSDETIETREENEEIETKFQAQSDDENIVELSGGSELEEEDYEYSSES